MERVQMSNPMMKRRTRKSASRVLAFFLAVVMVFSVTTTPVDAFSLGGFFKKVSNAISSTVKAVQRIVDTSDSKTVYSFSDLNSFTSSLFAPTNIKVKLGSNIYVPSNRNITSVLHNVEMDLNGKTIYSDNPSQTLFISYGRKFTISNGTIVQRRNNSSGIIYMSGGDAVINNVTFKKSGSASRVTGLYTTGILANPEIKFNNVTFDGMTTGLNIQYGARVVMTNSSIKNSQGDAVCLSGYYNGKSPRLDMNGGYIKYFKGNGINAGNGSIVNLTDVTVTGGTTRNRYGILAGKGSEVNLKGSTKVYSSAGGNIGVYKGYPVTIDSLGLANKYSFSVVDGLDGNNPAAVAEASFSGNIRSLPVYSDISRYMVRGENNKILIQNPPAQCNVTVQREWVVGKALDEIKDANYATVSVNGGAEGTSGSATVKYDAKVTLSTTNNNPERYNFLGWYKYVGSNPKVLISENPTCQVEVFDENVTYKAEYRYMQYTITTRANGKGSVSQSGSGTYYVDDSVTLTATASGGDGNATYAFNKWNDGNTESSRTITVTKNETYIGMFKKTGQTEGTLYLGLKEITSHADVPTGKELLLVYVGKGYEDNRMETGATGTDVAITGLPEGSAKMRVATDSEKTGEPYSTTSGQYSGTGANYYGAGTSATKSDTICVKWTQKADDFDDCNPGYIKRAYVNGSYCWLYWCCNGGIRAAGPYALYSYDKSITFNMNTVTLKMNPEFKPTTAGDTVNSSAIIAVATASDGKQYTLGGLKFGDESKGLDNQINYTQGDKTIALELDGITCDYDFPEATINGQQYTKLSDAIAAATASGNGETIKIVGPGVDSIDVTTPVALAVGDKIEGYDSETVTATEASQIGVDKDGTVRLTQGTLEVDPSTASQAAIGVKDAFAKTDKKIQVTTTDGGKNSVITPEEAGTTLQISPDNNPEHLVTINDAGGDGKTYEFDNIPSYAGETVQISKETEYTINLPSGNTTSGTAIKTSKYNTGDTTIESGTEDGNPVITSTKEGDKVTVGDNTYVTGKNENDEPTKYRVNPDQTKVPSVVLEQGSLGIPKDTTIQVKDTIIKNTGATSGGAVTGANPVQINASGEIEIPDGAGVTIDGVEIQVPAKTPMNGDTTVTLDDEGNPTIKTTGDSEVKLVDKNGKETTYQVGDYDCVLTIGDDGIPVIEDGEIRLQPGQTIKDRLGNEYKCPENAEGPITIMTTPLVYETDDEGNPITDEDGNPILVGGGDMSFIIPKDQSIQCKPKGSNSYLTFENPGSGSGFFNLDPTRAKDGIEADSELRLAPGKKLNLSAGEKSITVEAPESGNSGNILVDGSTGSVTLTKAGDKVIIDGKTYTAKADNTVFIVDENGVTLSDGKAAAEQGAAVNAEGLSITGASGSNTMQISTGTEGGEKSTTIQTSGKTDFSIAPVGKENAKINFETGSGDHSYPVGIDGSITLPKGETITRKSGSSQVEIKAPANADITMKPLPKPGADEIKDGNGEITPVGGLLLEVPTGSAITIGDKTYKETTIDNGRTGDDAYTLPMQLVLDEKGNVVLHNGTVELGKGADISLYDVGNELANFKNTSADDDKKVQITNPGIATMPESGTSVTMGNGKKQVEFTTTKENTQIAYTPDICLLKRGGVKLDPDEKILVSDMIVRNTSSQGKVKVALNEQLTEDGFIYSGKIEVTNGSSFELSSPGSKKAITYQSNVEGEGSAEFTINADGNLVLPERGIAKLKDSTGKVTEVQAGVEGIESIPTPEGAIFAIPTGGAIVVDNVAYKNTSASEYLVLSVNQDGKVVLVKGKVELAEGAIVYVKNEDEGLIPIKNNTDSSASEGTDTQAGKIRVTYDGVENQTDGNDQVSTTYSDVNIHVPSGGSISIGKNNYQAVQTEAGETDTKLSMSITAVTGSAVTDGNIPGNRIVLETGAVDLGKDSSITIHVPQNNPSATPKVLENIGGKDGNPILVGSDGKLELPTGSEIRVDDDTIIKVPAEGTDDYKAAVDLSENDGIVKIELQTENGIGKTGADKKVIINDDTYVSKENGKNLSLSIDTRKDDQVKLSGDSTSVGLSDGASITVGNTTVTAKSGTEITVTETTASDSTKVPRVDIPAGGEANIKNRNKNQDIDVNVPEKSGEDDTQTDAQKFTIGTDGSISTDLKKDETVVIGGIEYTGTSDSDSDNTIKVDGTTGELRDKPQGAPPIVSIDPEKFNKSNYQYTINPGESVTVNGVIYQAANDSAIILMGNPDGNPIVKLANADSAVIIDGTTYTAAASDTRFVLDENGKITLKNNSSTDPTANSSLKLTGKDAKTVNGVTYSGSTETDSYTVTYHEDGSYVSVTDGSKLLMNMPAGSKIYVADKGAVETTNETGAAITATFNGVIPVTMNGGSGNIYLDKTKEGYTDTAFVQILGVKEVELAYDETDGQENKTITSITVKQKKVVAPPQTSGSTENPDVKEEQQVSSIPVVGDAKDSEVKIPVIVEKDKVILDTITTEVVEKLVNTNTEGTKVVSIDCTTVEKPIVVLDVPTVENMSQKADQIKIITVSAEIEINKQAADAIIEQAVGSTIEIKVNSEEKAILNEAQKDTLKDYEVKTCLEAFVESSGTRIHDFKGGKVKVSIPWEIESGRKAVFYHVYYLDIDGVMHVYDTIYADRKLCFETEHFSEYVVVYDDEFLNATPVDDTPLLARVIKAGKTTLKLKWKPVEGAEKYTVYAAKCNTSNKTYQLKKVATVKASESTYVLKNLKPATQYKLVVKPISKDKKLNRSLTLRAVTSGGKYNNASGISIQQKNLTLKAGKTKSLKVRYTADDNSFKVGSPVHFVSSNKEIASVSAAGKIRAKRAGTCYIYAMLTSGEYAAVKVTVK